MRLSTPLVRFPPSPSKTCALALYRPSNAPCSLSLSLISRPCPILSGLLFDVDSGPAGVNKIVSRSGSVPGNSSTYDAVTRTTAFNVIDTIERKKYGLGGVLSKGRFPLCFVSEAEAGCPDVPFGETMHALAPGWWSRYLVAKRAVETRLGKSNERRDRIRSSIYPPSLIWDWTKFDAPLVIPVFSVLAAAGVSFMDKTVRVETLADAIVVGIEGGTWRGCSGWGRWRTSAFASGEGDANPVSGGCNGLWRQGEGVRERRSMQREFWRRLRIVPDISNWRDACMGLRRCEPSLTRARRECADYIG